jgi:hypothetical protein
MSDVLKTIEDRVRDKARKEWQAHVRNAFSSLKATLGGIPDAHVPFIVTKENHYPCGIASVLGWLESAIESAGAGAAEQKGIEEFMARAEVAGVDHERYRALEKKYRELVHRVEAAIEE